MKERYKLLILVLAFLGAYFFPGPIPSFADPAWKPF